MLSAEQAWERIAEELGRSPVDRIPRSEAVGRVVAETVVATVDVPSFDASAMDGFAVTGDLGPQASLPIAGVIVAGDAPGAVLPTGRAVRIMTGAPVPGGADRVVPIELTESDSVSVRFPEGARGPVHIRRRGEVTERGRELLRAGTAITPGTASLLATHGIAEVVVFAKPTVASITTGDEVVSPETVPAPGQLRDSHTDFLAAALGQLGIDLEPLGIAPDDVQELRSRIERGLRSDVLLMSGGVSMGDLDLVEDVLEQLGCRKLFDSVAIQPGKPVVVARHPAGWVFALPGNPASAMVAYWLFVRPALRHLLGYDDGYWRTALRARLAGPQPAGRRRDLFLPARVEFREGECHVQIVAPMGSHDVSAYAFGSALLRIPAGSEARQAGDECEILPLVDWPTEILG